MEYPDPGINEREAAVLGLLCENPLYGYTIEKIIDERGMRHWTDIGFSSIYYVLKRLERRDLITSSCEQQEDKPSRKVYTITKAGRELMKDKVRCLLAQPRRIASPFDLGIVHNPLLPREETIACLKERMTALDTSIRSLQSRRAKHQQNNKPYFVLALSDRTLAHLTTEKVWVEQFIREVERHAAE
jgi:DNA-binding PadR family transcriptional regulator